MSHSPQHKSDESQEAELISGLGSTVDTFASRIQRKLKQREEEDGQSQRMTEKRQALMLKAMTTIRKALQETCKINLGNRFTLEVNISDWDGWPRVDLEMIDSLCPEEPADFLRVTANDSKEDGAIRLINKRQNLLGELYLADPEALQQLPLVVKKSVRQFLDSIAPYVLNPKSPEEILAQQVKPIDVDEPQEIDEIGAKLKEQNLFTDDSLHKNDNIINTDEETTAPQPLRL